MEQKHCKNCDKKIEKKFIYCDDCAGIKYREKNRKWQTTFRNKKKLSLQKAD